MGTNDERSAADDDRAQAEREAQARDRLLAHGADALAPRPWRPPPMPPSATELTQYAVSRAGDLSREELLSALTLLPAARAEQDGIESGLLFLARSEGLTWSQIAEAMGFRSRQACQQYADRLNTRGENRP
ncbi:MAG: hypothetical protein QM809_16410 [Gordonia sp. (in: high G+C Gram-positive bacteria)]|uniref:hypothetical protein n=1 Tax=Gordonia sp. (in: high G+C Gram-positive bacteria) TaxID=84139 RepID=UPI0039E5F16C